MGETDRLPILCRYFRRYLASENSAAFIAGVSQHYTTVVLEHLARRGSREVRRAAVLAVGMVCDYASNRVLGEALRDDDRGVRTLAEGGIRQLWHRDGGTPQQQQLAELVRWNRSGEFSKAVEQAGRLLGEAPQLGEAWNQRAIALFQMGRFRESIADCRRALARNPYHFGAAIGMGHGYLELSRAPHALECFRRAIAIYPDLEGVRAQVRYLQRTLEGL